MANSRGHGAGWTGVRTWGIGSVLFVALGIGATAEIWLDSTDVAREKERTRELGAALASVLSTPVESLHAVVAFLETPRDALTLAGFRAFCRPALDRHHEMVALEWFPLVASEERAVFERLVRVEQPDFGLVELRGDTMVTAADGRSHFPLTFAEPVVSGVMGLDLTFDAARAGPAWRALESRRLTLSDRFRLVEDPPGVQSVVAYAPVFRAQWVDAERFPGTPFARGVAVGLFRLDSLVAAAMARQEIAGLGLTLTDLGARRGLGSLFSTGAKPGMRVWATKVPFVDRVYELNVHFPPAPAVHALAIAAFLATLGLGLLALELLISRRNEGLLSRRLEYLGQYRLEALIGGGGMGRVYRARHAVLRRPAAIKIALPGTSIERFEREAQLHASLSHPNTVTLYDYGRGDGDTCYVAMELVCGYDLWALVQRTGRLRPARAVSIIVQAAAALEEAHEVGLVHRDIKPSNIMVSVHGGLYDHVKVLDFGLARSWDPSMEAPTGTLPGGPVAFAGTPGYVAPEVVSGEPASRASDIFSLGTVAYFLLEGIGPFVAPTSFGSLTRTLAGEVSPLSTDLPEALRQLVTECLAHEPERRPRSMRQLEQRFRALLSELPPFGEAEAEAWWREHPPGEGEPLPERSFSLLLADRGLG